ncbi:MAG TPA: MBL fold metallo-hydrolase [Polyangiaceae bacterium]
MNNHVGVFGLAMLTCACSAAPSAEHHASNSPMTPGEGHVGGTASGLQVRWLGGPTAVLESGGLRVLTDPMFGPRGDSAFTLPKHPSTGVANAKVARYTAPPPFSTEGLSVILISHTHNDHFDETAKHSLPKNLPVVVAAAGAESVRAAGFTDVRALDWGESLSITVGATVLRAVAIPAHHAHDAQLDRDLGRGNGYVLEWQTGRTNFRVYWTGDAVLTDDTRDFVARHGTIDLLLPHLGGVGGDGDLGLRTMNAEETMELARRVAPRWVVPIHHTTFAHYREPIAALEERAREAGELQRFRFLREGESVAVNK